MVLLDLKYSGPYALYFPTKGWIDFFFFMETLPKNEGENFFRNLQKTSVCEVSHAHS